MVNDRLRDLARAVILDVSIDLDPEVIELARLNKVLLHVLRVSNYDGELRSSQEDGLRRVVNVVAEVEDALGSIEHAFIKLVKPVVYVPADIDILVRRDQVLLAASRLVRLGYRVLLYEPYTVTLVKNGINVDLYVHPSAANLVYARGEDFLRSRVETVYNGIRVVSIDRDHEVVLTVLHAVYKEGIVTLNDVATVIKWLSDEAVKLCLRLRCTQALEFVLTVALLSMMGSATLPYKLPIGYWSSKLISRVLGNAAYVPSILQGIRRLGDVRLLSQLASRIARVSY
ncbi:MAG: nucleotidyltransferase family protein [Vulcanisaeta sp.]